MKFKYIHNDKNIVEIYYKNQYDTIYQHKLYQQIPKQYIKTVSITLKDFYMSFNNILCNNKKIKNKFKSYIGRHHRIHLHDPSGYNTYSKIYLELYMTCYKRNDFINISYITNNNLQILKNAIDIEKTIFQYLNKKII